MTPRWMDLHGLVALKFRQTRPTVTWLAVRLGIDGRKLRYAA